MKSEKFGMFPKVQMALCGSQHYKMKDICNLKGWDDDQHPSQTMIKIVI